MPVSEIRVDLLGTSFLMSVDEDPVYLQSILNRYKTIIEQTKKVTGLEDSLKIAILTGLQLCDDLEKLRIHQLSGEDTADSTEVEKKLLDLIERIDRAIPPGFAGRQ